MTKRTLSRLRKLPEFGDVPKPRVIWLAPTCAGCIGERLWCEMPAEPCSECGRGWLRYMIDRRFVSVSERAVADKLGGGIDE